MWQECPGRSDLETEDGGPVTVLYPGRPNDGGGADFREAVIQTEHGRLTGDIEIHTKSSHWRAHRHHRDPLYNRVILHVVFRHDTVKPVRLENGHSVPTLSLEKLLTEKRNTSSLPAAPVPCRGLGKRWEIGRLGDGLDAAGEERFRARAAGFQTVTSPVEAGQALYRGIMGALGYARNKHPMMALAGRIPLRRLETMATRATPDEECGAMYQAVLTGTAGLLPSQRDRRRPDGDDDTWTARLEKLWAATGGVAVMSASDWEFFRVRPVNFPARRIAAMSRLLLRYRDGGLLAGLLGEVDKLPADASHDELEKALIIGAGDGYRPAGKNGPSLLGRERAADIVINVLLPFTMAWSRINTRPELAEKAAGLYRRYPALKENTIARHMRRQLGIAGPAIHTARRQQGLLHIFQTFCTTGGCPDCPFIRLFNGL